jgi:hypothetical protein
MNSILLSVSLIQLLLFSSYIGYLLYKFKHPLPSISQSWYELKPHKLSHLFTTWTSLLGITLIAQGGFLLLLSGISLLFVGIANKFKSTRGWVREIHFGGAISAIFLSSLSLYVEGIQWPLLFLLLLVVGTIASEIRDKVWWIEVGAFALIWGGLMERAILG